MNIRLANYESFDNAIIYIVSLGSGFTISKIDQKSALRLFPVHPTDQHKPSMQWDGKLHFKKTLAMSLASFCKIFKCFSFVLAWIILKFIKTLL